MRGNQGSYLIWMLVLLQIKENEKNSYVNVQQKAVRTTHRRPHREVRERPLRPASVPPSVLMTN